MSFYSDCDVRPNQTSLLYGNGRQVGQQIDDFPKVMSQILERIP